MLKDRVSAVHAVANAFIATEAVVDRSATDAARCMAIMMEQRAKANLPLPTGLDALAHVSRAAALLVEARQAFIEAHRCLNEVPRQIGLERMYGKDDNNPPNGPAPSFFVTGADAGQAQAAA
jgi:hypothetical protein